MKAVIAYPCSNHAYSFAKRILAKTVKTINGAKSATTYKILKRLAVVAVKPGI